MQFFNDSTKSVCGSAGVLRRRVGWFAWFGRVYLGREGLALRFRNGSTKSVYGSAKGCIRFCGPVTTLPRALQRYVSSG